MESGYRVDNHKIVLGEVCPECGCGTVHACGCESCPSCGYSKCLG